LQPPEWCEPPPQQQLTWQEQHEKHEKKASKKQNIVVTSEDGLKVATDLIQVNEIAGFRVVISSHFGGTPYLAPGDWIGQKYLSG
jgi:hypothetical protein